MVWLPCSFRRNLADAATYADLLWKENTVDGLWPYSFRWNLVDTATYADLL
jgi:hypothetical protein